MVDSTSPKIKLPGLLTEVKEDTDTAPKKNRMEMMRNRVRTSLFNAKPSSPAVTSRTIEFESAPLRVLPKSDSNSPNNQPESNESNDFDFLPSQIKAKEGLAQRNHSIFAMLNPDKSLVIERELSDKGFYDLQSMTSLNRRVTDQEGGSEGNFRHVMLESNLKSLSSMPISETATQDSASVQDKNPMISSLNANNFDPDEMIQDVTPKVHTIFQQFRPSEEKKLSAPEENVHYISSSFKDYFDEHEILGEGTSGTVKRCRSRTDGQDYAVKIVNYRGDDELKTLILSEFKNLRRLKHKNIVQVLDQYIDETRGKIYTVLELVKGKEMFEIIHQIGSYSEYVASSIFKQILLAIQYMHFNGVCHRDLKPNNILVSEDGSIVKITDFNVSKFTDEDKKSHYTGLSNENYRMWTYTGTIAFTAPEVFTDTEYTESVDMWSAGVVLYTMLSGYQPFQAEYLNDLIELIKKGNVSYEGPAWDRISLEAKDLVKRLLNKNYKERYSPSQALSHSWIQKIGRVSGKKMETTIQNLKSNIRKNAKTHLYLDQTDSTDTRTKSESPLKSKLSPFDSPLKFNLNKSLNDFPLESPETLSTKSRRMLFEEIEEIDESKH